MLVQKLLYSCKQRMSPIISATSNSFDNVHLYSANHLQLYLLKVLLFSFILCTLTTHKDLCRRPLTFKRQMPIALLQP